MALGAALLVSALILPAPLKTEPEVVYRPTIPQSPFLDAAFVYSPRLDRPLEDQLHPDGRFIIQYPDPDIVGPL